MKVKQLEEEIQNLKGILEEQSKAIVEIREEKDQLLEEKQSWLKEKVIHFSCSSLFFPSFLTLQDNLNQKILTKIYDSLLENKSNGKEEQTEVS